MFSPHSTSLPQCAFLCILLVALLSLTEQAPAQGIERESVAGPEAAEAMHGSDVNQPYNLQLGPVTLRADASLSTTFDDNINLAKTGRAADVIITPNFGVHGLWQISDLNTLSFDLGIGYEAYVTHSQNDSINVTPDSQLQFNVFAGDFKFNFHDNFSYQNDPISVGQLSNDSQFSRFTNDAGLTVTWDLSDILLTLGYDHTNFWVFQSQFSYLDYQQDAVSPSITFNVSKTIQAGINASFTDMRYAQNIQNNNTGFTAGPFVTAQINEYLSVNAQAGYQLTDYNKGGLNGDTENNSTYYGSVGLSHEINDVLTESLSGGRQSIPGLTSNFTERDYINYGLSWQATSYFNLGGTLWYENLDDSDAIFRQTSSRYGAGLTAGYNINDHAGLTLAYQYVLKTSDQTDLGYYDDQVTLALHYQF